MSKPWIIRSPLVKAITVLLWISALVHGITDFIGWLT